MKTRCILRAMLKLLVEIANWVGLLAWEGKYFNIFFLNKFFLISRRRETCSFAIYCALKTHTEQKFNLQIEKLIQAYLKDTRKGFQYQIDVFENIEIMVTFVHDMKIQIVFKIPSTSARKKNMNASKDW